MEQAAFPKSGCPREARVETEVLSLLSFFFLLLRFTPYSMSLLLLFSLAPRVARRAKARAVEVAENGAIGIFGGEVAQTELDGAELVEDSSGRVRNQLGVPEPRMATCLRLHRLCPSDIHFPRWWRPRRRHTLAVVVEELSSAGKAVSRGDAGAALIVVIVRGDGFSGWVISSGG